MIGPKNLVSRFLFLTVFFQQEDKLDFAASPHDDKKSDSDNVIDEIELTEEQKVTARLADNLVELLAKQQSQQHSAISTTSDDAGELTFDVKFLK